MYYKKFKKDDLIYNTIITHPEYEFFINNSLVFLNRETQKNGDFSNTIKHIGRGHISLNEININRPSDSMVEPFFVWDGVRENMLTFSNSNSDNLSVGDQLLGSYPVSASVSRIYFDHDAAVNNQKYIHALRNPIELSGELSSNNKFSNFSGEDVNIIAIPSVFYGSKIKKGSLKLDLYIDGVLTATLEDNKKNGKLAETFGPNSGSVAGIALYDCGMILLTSSLPLDTSTNSYGEAPSNPAWLNFGSGIPEVNAVTAAGTAVGSNHSVNQVPSYKISFKGTNKIPTMTLLAHADKGELNYSTNPTFIDIDTPQTASLNRDFYNESVSKIKNIKKSKYINFEEEEFENTTYLSQIGIYDKNKTLIAVAKLANPVKKTEIQDYMFKLRMDF